MKHKLLITVFLFGCILNGHSQETAKKQRLDFAKTYFEYGGEYMPSFDGKQLLNGKVNSFTHSASVNQYLTWGGYHFWGHAEFYVIIPLKHNSLTNNEKTDYELFHSVATGGRFYPWAVKDKAIRPYLGLSWGALDFKQKIEPEEYQTTISKDFMLNYEVGCTFNYKSFGVRLGLNYFKDNKWQYPISKTTKSEIITPAYSLQLGLIYAYESSGNSKHPTVNEWNDYPRKSKLSHNAGKFGDFFVGAGPSSSFSLKKSDYNVSQLPFLKEKLTSGAYVDLSVGYQFNKLDLFVALSYRNPTFKTAGYGVKQTIRKNSLAFEVSRYLTDYTGFAPYIGVNVAYDKLKYQEEIDGVKSELNFSGKIEPGLTFGWDIVPGKTLEALILRTNLRWYPFSSFEVDGKQFDLSQLEYNLIQVVFYPGRLVKKRK